MKNVRTAVAMLLAAFIAQGCALTWQGKPMLGVAGDKDKNGTPVPPFGTMIVVNQYGTQVQPQPSAPGTPPAPPPLQPSGTAVPLQRVGYKTVYPSKWDDPTLVVIQNQSSRFVRVKIDDAKEEIRLSPFQATTDLGFDVGEHRVRATIEKPTANFGMKTVERTTSFIVRPEGRSQIVSIYDW